MLGLNFREGGTLVMVKYSVKEVADELDVCYSTALKLLHSGRMKGIQQGGRWYVTEAELRRYYSEGNHPDSVEAEAEEVSARQ